MHERERAITWTLSGFGDEIDPEPAVQIAVLKALGAGHIEVRSAWRTNIVDLDDEQLDRLAGILSAEGMGVSAIASPIGKVEADQGPDGELARLGRAIDAAHRMDARHIRVFSYFQSPDRSVEAMRDDVLTNMAALAALAEKEDVVLVLENEKRLYGDIPERVLDVIESVGSPALRIAWDSANFVQVGVEAPHDRGYPLLAPHIAYLQVKDAQAGTGQVVPAGQGDGQVAATAAALARDGYRGFASLEPHLASAHELGGFSGPVAFGEAARAFSKILDELGVVVS